MVSIGDRESSLIERFVASFTELDEMSANEVTNPVGWQLSVGQPDEYGFKRWQPVEVNTDRSLLELLYSKLPARFPPLYERLILSYRWAEVDLQNYRLLANPPGPDLSGLLAEMSKDKVLWSALLQAGYIQFGKGSGGDYDPVCFEIKSRKKNGDCRIVKIDHEEILCNNRVKVKAELAPTFEQVALHTIEQANQA
jgi:hypothetical protein